MKANWDEIKKRIRSEIPKKPFSLWIDPIQFLEKKDQAVVLSCPNKFSCNWVKENYLGLIRDQFHVAGMGSFEIVFKVMPKKRQESVLGCDTKQLRFATMPKKPRDGWMRLNSDFTFNRFVVGPCNEFAYSAARAVAQGGGWDYQSLLMLSNTGLGKTHLSQAVCHAIWGQDARRRVYYLTAEDFTNEMVSSLKGNRIEAFKDKYRRNCDVLILEEVHFLGGKEKTQVELGYTLDALSNADRKVIFTSSLPPKDIPRLSKELSSRLSAGLMTSIGQPDHETRVKILTHKAQEHGVVLSNEIIELLASRLKGDIRQMGCALKCLKARAQFLKAKIDLGMAEEVLSRLDGSMHSVGLADIKDLVCQYYKIDPQVLPSKSRKQVYAYPRNIYVYLCRRFTDETIEAIAQSVGRTHPTIVYASELVEKKMKTDSKLKRQIDFLSKKIGDIKP